MMSYAECAAYTLFGAEQRALIVALHGLAGVRSQPLRYLDGIELPGFGVLAPDLRAHGDTTLTGPAEEFTPQWLADDVEDLLRRLGLESRPLCVLGVSLGATVALELLRRRSLDVAGAIFIRPAHGSVPPEHLRINALIGAWLADTPDQALSRLLASREYLEVAATSSAAARSLREKAVQPGSAQRSMRLRAGNWTAFEPDERIAGIVPSIILAAQRDPLHPVAVAKEWRARIAGSSLVMLPPRDSDEPAYWAAARSAIGVFLAGIARSIVTS